MGTMIQSILDACRADSIPAGESGLWQVKKWSISRPVFSKRECDGKGVLIRPGSYTNLHRLTDKTMHLTVGDLIMHDEPSELRKHLEFILKAKGNVLVSGLGLGCVVRGTLRNPRVARIVVVENSADVISLVWPWMPHIPNLRLVKADALEYAKAPDEAFDCAWHDLWTDQDSGQPHLQTVHMRLICEMAGRIEFQGAWQFPRYYRKLTPTVI